MTEMNGTDALVLAAKHANVACAVGVPGYPVTRLMHDLSAAVVSEWMVNEKVAMEYALGASIAGKRVLVVTKHVGMNVLADPLVSAVTHTIGSGVVIIAGDDPAVRMSQNEQDSRYYGLVAEVPVFDPKDPQACYDSLIEAFEISESLSVPVIMRITNRMMKSKGAVEQKKQNEGEPTDPASRLYDRNIWHYTMRGKHQRFHASVYGDERMLAERTAEIAAEPSVASCSNSPSRIGIISSGYPSVLVDEVIQRNDAIDIIHLPLALVNPLPVNAISKFASCVEYFLVVEETEPVIEQQLQGMGNIRGKLTGHLPHTIIETSDIENAISGIAQDSMDIPVCVETLDNRGEPRTICPDCDFMVLYNALSRLKRKYSKEGLIMAGDVGCSVRTTAPPLNLVDAGFCLGSSIAVATGANGVAVTGDYALAHSGICALIDAVQKKRDILIVVVKNDVAAMTGGQDVPDLSEMVMNYVEDSMVVSSKMSEDEMLELFDSRYNASGVSVVFVQGMCKRDKKDS